MARRAQAFFHKDWNSWTVGTHDTSRAGAADAYTTYPNQKAAEAAAKKINAQEDRNARDRAKPPSAAALLRRGKAEHEAGRTDALARLSPVLHTTAYLQGFAMGRGRLARNERRLPRAEDLRDTWYMKGFNS